MIQIHIIHVISVGLISFGVGGLITMIIMMPCLYELTSYQALDKKNKKISELNNSENRK